MQLHVGSRYEAEGFNGILDGVETPIFNVALAVVEGNAVTLEADDTPSDNKVNLQTSTNLEDTALLSGTATNEAGDRNFLLVPEPVELIPKDQPVGSFNLRLVELVG